MNKTDDLKHNGMSSDIYTLITDSSLLAQTTDHEEIEEIATDDAVTNDAVTDDADAVTDDVKGEQATQKEE
jgi:hypothetical protein